MTCKKCAQLLELYERTPKDPRDYWLMTEIFVMLHGGDVCKEAECGMTRDEVLAMSDNELWEHALRALNGAGSTDPHVVDPDGRAWTTVVGEKVWREDCDFPNHIAAAWELVRELQRRGFEVSVHTGIINTDSGELVAMSSVLIWGHDDIFFEAMADREEEPKAITRAFILAMEST